MAKMVISVVIPTMGQVDQICKCIDSILKQTLLPDEIIIVDSGKDTDLDLHLKRRFPSFHSKIKYVHFEACLTAARNIGVEQSSGDIVFFFDDDVVLDKDYVKEVVKVFRSDKDGKIGGVMGNMTTRKKRDTTSLTSKLMRLFFQNYFGDGRTRLSGLQTYVQGETKIMKTEFLSGCMSAYRRKVLDEFKFDEKLGVLGGYCFAEDRDFSYRVSRKYTLIYTPFAKLEHRPPTKMTSSFRRRQWIFNHFYLFKKNMPKRLSNIFAFVISVYGMLLLTLILERNLKGFIGCLQGIEAVKSKIL